MTEDRKNELSQMCAVQIRQATVIAKSLMSDYGYHFVETVFDAEFWSMIPRLSGKPVTEADMPLLRELVMADLWPRLKAAHREHRQTLFGHVKAMYPESILADAEFAFDVGWAGLVQDAAVRILTYPKAWSALIDGGKEKFGCLVLHIDFDSSQRGARSEVERLREEIRLRSLATCDVCGESGRLRISSTIAKTVCDRHSGILGEMREDDGRWADPWRWSEEHDPAVVDPIRKTALGRRIDDDTQAAVGRRRELLIEYAYYIDAAVRGAGYVVDDQRAGAKEPGRLAHAQSVVLARRVFDGDDRVVEHPAGHDSEPLP